MVYASTHHSKKHVESTLQCIATYVKGSDRGGVVGGKGLSAGKGSGSGERLEPFPTASPPSREELPEPFPAASEDSGNGTLHC